MPSFSFSQVDVFTSQALKGNPLAVVVGADGLTDDQMASVARWTNLSETTFLLNASESGADYRLRIFTPHRELKFAGHPTLGSCHVWLAQNKGAQSRDIVQECEIGLVRIRCRSGQLSFAAPPMLRTGPLDSHVLAQALSGLGLVRRDVVASQWVDNGPGWVGLLLASRQTVLNVRADYAKLAGLPVGIVGPWISTIDGTDADFEVRAFSLGGYEDPVTGSLNASLAQWLIGDHLAPSRYIASQGTVLKRSGRVHIEKQGSDVWVGGQVITIVEGVLAL